MTFSHDSLGRPFRLLHKRPSPPGSLMAQIERRGPGANSCVQPGRTELAALGCRRHSPRLAVAWAQGGRGTERSGLRLALRVCARPLILRPLLRGRGASSANPLNLQTPTSVRNRFFPDTIHSTSSQWSLSPLKSQGFGSLTARLPSLFKLALPLSSRRTDMAT